MRTNVTPTAAELGWLADELGTPEARLLHEQEYLIVEATSAIERAMDAASVSRTDLAERLSLSKAAVTQMLAGTRNLTLRTLATIAFALECRISVELEPVESAWSGLRELPEPILRESLWQLTQAPAMSPTPGTSYASSNTDMALAA
jgi:transcriptional regulator with XRE-family HTH domain